MKDLTQTKRGKTISFFNELDIENYARVWFQTSLKSENHAQRRESCSKTFVSFLNEVAAEMKTLSSEVVSFFNELEIKKPCSRTFVSFFNEVSSETQKPSSKVVSFFNELEIRKPCSKTSVSFFNEVASEMEKNIFESGFIF
jgi:uncharacterized protein YjbK